MQSASIERAGGSLRWIADHNPFYLLSAFCGLLGCWLLGDLTAQDIAGAAERIIGVLAYELAVVGLAVWLARQAGMRRDAAILSFLTLVLAADFSFFYIQAAMVGKNAALAFSLFGGAQAVAAVGLLLRGLGLRLSRSAQWLLAADFLAIHIAPFALRWPAENAANMTLAFLAAFAIVGALVAAHAMPRRWHVHASGETDSSLASTLAIVTPVLALTALAVHVIAVEWIYDIGFYTVFVSPLLLGISCVCQRQERQWMGVATENWGILFTVSAIILALGEIPHRLLWISHDWPWLGVTPLRLVLIAASILFWTDWRARRGIVSFLLGCGATLMALLGPSPRTMASHFVEICQRASQLLSWSFPTSRLGWGLLLFISAFVLLGAGACLSWWKSREATAKVHSLGPSGKTMNLSTSGDAPGS